MNNIQTGYIYKITNIINNKIYIGQTHIKNPIKRWADHFNDAYVNHHDYFLYRALRKSGIENFTFQIIEKDIPIKDLNEREMFFIKLFNSNDSEFGYNLTKGGQLSHSSKYNLDQVLKVISDIKKYPEKTLSQIAKDNHMSRESVSDINNGDTWFLDSEIYPIRKCVMKDFLSSDDVCEIKNMLRRGMSATEISKIFNVSVTNITNINNGKIFKDKNQKYPIFKATNARCHLNINEITTVIYYLLNTNYNYNQISDILHIGRKTISNIDQGKGYIKELKELGYEKFPIREK